jgi:hypothetical protein
LFSAVRLANSAYGFYITNGYLTALALVRKVFGMAKNTAQFFPVLQFTLFTFVANLISIPYTSSIIAHEKMDFYAFVSVLDAFLKLIVAYLLFYVFYDRLIVYAILFFIVALIIRFVSVIYCKKKFEECTYLLVVDKHLFKSVSVCSKVTLKRTISQLF